MGKHDFQAPSSLNVFSPKACNSVLLTFVLQYLDMVSALTIREEGFTYIL